MLLATLIRPFHHSLLSFPCGHKSLASAEAAGKSLTQTFISLFLFPHPFCFLLFLPQLQECTFNHTRYNLLLCIKHTVPGPMHHHHRPDHKCVTLCITIHWSSGPRIETLTQRSIAPLFREPTQSTDLEDITSSHHVTLFLSEIQKQNTKTKQKTFAGKWTLWSWSSHSFLTFTCILITQLINYSSANLSLLEAVTRCSG